MPVIARSTTPLRLAVMVAALCLLFACSRQPTPMATEPAANGAAATTQVSIPNVSSGAGPAGGQGQGPAPQPGLSPTQGQSGVPAPGPAVPAGAVQPVDIVTADGVTLAGTFYAPAKPNSPALIMLHMLDRQRGDWDTLARTVQAAGYGVLTIDLRGHGASGGDREWLKMVDDTADAYAWLANRPEIDPARIGVVGASVGANLALNFAAREPAVKTVILLSAGLNFRGLAAEPAMKAYGARPVMLAASAQDRAAAAVMDRLQKLAQGRQSVLLLQNQGHGTNMLGRENGLEEAILKWLQETL